MGKGHEIYYLEYKEPELVMFAYNNTQGITKV